MKPAGRWERLYLTVLAGTFGRPVLEETMVATLIRRKDSLERQARIREIVRSFLNANT
jgi:hypothetical protein